MSFQQYTVDNNLTSVDAASDGNLIAQYYNGQLNNGVNATLTFPTGPFVVDTLAIEGGMSVLLKDQTNAFENGIYFSQQTGDSSTQAILIRRSDFQCVEQLNAGQFLSVGNGSANKGAIFTFVEPLPVIIGVDDINFVNSISEDLIIELETDNPGTVTGMDVSIYDSVAINNAGANLTAVKGSVLPTGVTNCDQINAVQGVIRSQGGTYAVAAKLSGVSSVLDFTVSGSTVNAAEINGFYVNYVGTSTATNLNNVNGFKSYNDTLQSIGCHYYMWGPANYAFSFQGVTGNYYLMSGTAAGSPGDPTHCNAPRAIKIFANNVEVGYIPVFLQNT